MRMTLSGSALALVLALGGAAVAAQDQPLSPPAQQPAAGQDANGPPSMANQPAAPADQPVAAKVAPQQGQSAPPQQGQPVQQAQQPPQDVPKASQQAQQNAPAKPESKQGDTPTSAFAG